MYVFDNAAPESAGRLRLLPEIFDAETTRHLEARGIAAGWHCLEIGGGGGSVGQWLAQRAGPTGHVLITDIDTRHLPAPSSTNVEILRHDIQSESLPGKNFDLVHARLVLVHLPERERVLARLFDALKPGGWLVLEEFQTLSVEQTVSSAHLDRVANAVRATRQVSINAGVDPTFGRALPSRIRAHGLINVAVEGRSFNWRGGSAGATLLRLNCEQVHSAALATGLCSEGDIASYLASLDDPEFEITSPIMWSAWGQRPQE